MSAKSTPSTPTNKESAMKRQKSYLINLSNKVIPLLERAKEQDKQDYHYRYLVGTMEYILHNFHKTKHRKKHCILKNTSKKGYKMNKSTQIIDHILTSAVRIDSSTKSLQSSLKALEKDLYKLTAHDCVVIDRQTLKEYRYIGRAINASTESTESMVLYQDSDENYFYVRSLSDFAKKFDFKETK